MLPRSNARRTAKPLNTKKGCTQIIMSTAFFLTSSSCHPRNTNHLIFLGKNAKNQVISRIGGRACYFMRLFARHPIQQEQLLIIKHLQACLKKVTKSGDNNEYSLFCVYHILHLHAYCFFYYYVCTILRPASMRKKMNSKMVKPHNDEPP